MTAVGLQTVAHFLDGFEQVSRAIGAGVIPAVVAGLAEAAVAELRLPVEIRLELIRFRLGIVIPLSRSRSGRDVLIRLRGLFLLGRRKQWIAVARLSIPIHATWTAQAHRSDGLDLREAMSRQARRPGRAPDGGIEVADAALADVGVGGGGGVVEGLGLRFEVILVSTGGPLSRLRVLQEQGVAVSLILGIVELGIRPVIVLDRRGREVVVIVVIPSARSFGWDERRWRSREATALAVNAACFASSGGTFG